MSKYLLSILGFLFLFQLKALGQHVLNFDELKIKYPDKQAVITAKKEIVKISLDKNDSLDITLSYHSEMVHLSDRTEGYAESSVHFSDFVEIKELEAKTLVPVKSSYKQLKVSEFETRKLNSSGVFFDDSKVKVFNYPGVQPGAKTLLSYTQKFKEPRLLSPFYFSYYVPVEESEITVMVDKRVKLGYRLFNNHQSKVSFSESSEGNFIVYKWKIKEASEYLNESNSQSISYHEPHLIYFIEEIHSKNRNEIFLRDTKDLYHWYYNLAIKSQVKAGTELKGIVDSLMVGMNSPDEKTKKIFYWVQDHVKYVAFEDGYGGFIPRDANLVCNRRYGDCKDMANLLVNMLKQAGLPAYHVWIGTRDIPYSYRELPSTNVDNHMIAAVKIDGQYIFLDATGQYGTLSQPTSMIQGKEALIGIGENNFEIVNVPVMEASTNKIVDTTYCRIDNKLLKGNGIVSISGYNKIDYTYSISYSKPEERVEILKAICTKGSNKFSMINYDLKNLFSKESPLTLKYDFELDDYIKSNGKEIYVNLNLDRTFDKERIDTLKRKLPIERDYKFTQEDVIVFEMPSKYSVDYLPASIKEKNDFFEVEINYEVKQSKIIYHKRIVVNSLLLEKKNFNDWNKIINKLSQAYREVIILKQK